MKFLSKNSKGLRVVLSMVLTMAMVLSMALTPATTASAATSKTLLEHADFKVVVNEENSSTCKIVFTPTQSAAYVIIHYTVNGGGQMNITMANNGGKWEQTISDLKKGDTISCNFTYEKGGPQYDSQFMDYVVGSATTSSGNTSTGNNGTTGSTSQGNGVTMYTDANYSGKAVTFGVGEYNMSAMQNAGIPNDAISSIKVPLGYKLTVFWDINFSGSSKVFAGDSSYVGNDWNDQITSFKVEEATYYIYNKNSGLVLDVAGAGLDNGTNLQQYSWNGTDAQKFKVSAVENGYYKITTVLNGKAVDVADVSKSNGANVHVWDYVGGENQKWAINFVDGSYATIVSKNSGLSLDADAWSTTPGGNVIQWQLGDKQANQLWKFELADGSTPVVGGGDPVTPPGGGSFGGNDYADKPVLRTDIAKRDNQMFFQFNNKTNGKYSDNQIYWCILGFDPATMKLCYVDPNGNLIPATTGLNTIAKGDRMCADIFYTLAEKNYVYMPNIVSGRMYISYGSPVYVTINSDANGNVGFAGPDLNNPTDPNQDVLFEFVEFTITNGEYWGNTTRVDFFSFPVVSRLVGEGGFVSVPGDADKFDKTVGDIGTRDEIFNAFRNEVPNEFKSLVQDLRIMAPAKATFNEGQQYGNYFDSYINSIWEEYRNKDLVFTCQPGTFRGRVVGNQMIFSQDGGATGLVVNKPTTQDAFEGKGALATGNTMELVVQAQLCAAINRGVAHLTNSQWDNASLFYQNDKANFYAGFFHRHSVDGLAYGFCYDDVYDYSTLLHYTKPTALVIDLKW